jgi:hypothetical protein
VAIVLSRPREQKTFFIGTNLTLGSAYYETLRLHFFPMLPGPIILNFNTPGTHDTDNHYYQKKLGLAAWLAGAVAAKRSSGHGALDIKCFLAYLCLYVLG